MKKTKLSNTQAYEKEYKVKKNRFILQWSATALMVVVCFFIISQLGYYWSDNSKQKDIRNTYQEYTNYLYSDGSITEEKLSELDSFISSFPEQIEKAIKEEWVIVVCEKIPECMSQQMRNEQQYCDTSNLVNGGFTFTQQRVVYVCSSNGDIILNKSFTHELGHVVSFLYHSTHGSPKWLKIYDSDKASFDTEMYYLSTSAEFFASCFEEYYNSPEHLKRYSEGAYNYIENLLNTNYKTSGIEVRIDVCINTLAYYYSLYM